MCAAQKRDPPNGGTNSASALGAAVSPPSLAACLLSVFLSPGPSLAIFTPSSSRFVSHNLSLPSSCLSLPCLSLSPSKMPSIQDDPGTPLPCMHLPPFSPTTTKRQNRPPPKPHAPTNHAALFFSPERERRRAAAAARGASGGKAKALALLFLPGPRRPTGFARAHLECTDPYNTPTTPTGNTPQQTTSQQLCPFWSTHTHAPTRITYTAPQRLAASLAHNAPSLGAPPVLSRHSP